MRRIALMDIKLKMISVIVLILSYTMRSSDANFCDDFKISSLAGVWQAVGFSTCERCNQNAATFMNISLCTPLANSPCGTDSAVCYTDSTVYPNLRNVGKFSSHKPTYNMINRTLEITYEFNLPSNTAVNI